MIDEREEAKERGEIANPNSVGSFSWRLAQEETEKKPTLVEIARAQGRDFDKSFPKEPEIDPLAAFEEKPKHRIDRTAEPEARWTKDAWGRLVLTPQKWQKYPGGL